MEKIRLFLIAFLLLCLTFSVYACNKSKSSTSSSFSSSEISSSESSTSSQSSSSSIIESSSSSIEESSSSIEESSSESSSSSLEDSSVEESSSSTSSESSSSSSSSQEIYYDVTCFSTNGGTITADKESCLEGETVTITLSAKIGFELSKLTLSYGENEQELSVSDGVATFTMPASNVTVTAEWSDTRELVDYLVLGDSYTDYGGWAGFYNDMKDLPNAKTIGVGGSSIPQWGKSNTTFSNPLILATGGLDDSVTRYDGTVISTNVLGNYSVKNFIFHIGVNDIRSGTANKDIAVADLKQLFEQYHTEYPDANIYWVSLSLNVQDLQYTDTFKAVNKEMKEYADECDYLTYINTVDTMFPDGQPHGDWFVDGLHFNPDGYATWSSLITEALGYPRADVDVFGSADLYYSSNTWTYDENAKTITNSTKAIYSEESIWFNDVFSTDLYAEMEICVNKPENNSQWPKVGLAVKGKNNHAFFFIETKRDLTGNLVNYTERRAFKRGTNTYETSDWDWTIQGNNWTGVPSLKYTNGNFAKLGLLRCGADMYFFVNDELVFTRGGVVGCDDNMAIGLTLIDLNVTIKNYSVTTNVDDIIKQYNITNAPNVSFEGVNTPHFTNETQNGDIVKNVLNYTGKKFYFETEITLDNALTIPNDTKVDEYPKAGIIMQAGGCSLWFYIDAVNTGDFGGCKTIGIVYRPNGSNWLWSETKTITAPTLAYTNSSYAKLAVYKDGARMVFMLNDLPILETSDYADLADEVTVGFYEYNLAFKVRNSKIATSDTILDLVEEKVGFNYEVSLDGDLSDWDSQAKTNYYGKTASDNSGKSFKVYAYMGKNAVYVGYEIVSSTYIDNTAEWWLSTNAEMRAKNNNNAHIYASSNGQSNNVLTHAVKTSYNNNLYTTYIEIAISYEALNATPNSDFVNIMFAARPGNEDGAGLCLGGNGVWWAGDYNPEGDVIPFNITTDGIKYNIDFAISGVLLDQTTYFNTNNKTYVSNDANGWLKMGYLTKALTKGSFVEFSINTTNAQQLLWGISTKEYIEDYNLSPTTKGWLINDTTSNLNQLFVAEYNLFSGTGTERENLSWLTKINDISQVANGKTFFENTSLDIKSLINDNNSIKIRFVLDDQLLMYVNDQLFTASNMPNWKIENNKEYYLSFAGANTVITILDTGIDSYIANRGNAGQTLTSPLTEEDFSGKNITLLGDSITYGVGVSDPSKRYSTLLSNSLVMTENNMGISGTVLCTGGHRTSRLEDVKNINYNSDYVGVLLGINDFDQCKNDGQTTYYSLGEFGSKDTSTIYGALDKLCFDLTNKFRLTDTKIFLMTPVITSWNNSVSSERDWDQTKTNACGYTLRELCDAIKQVANYYGIITLDLNAQCQMTENDFSDGIHPNDSGAQKMADTIKEFLLTNYYYENI